MLQLVRGYLMHEGHLGTLKILDKGTTVNYPEEEGDDIEDEDESPNKNQKKHGNYCSRSTTV